MIVEANSVMMLGRQVGGPGGEAAVGNGSAAIPFKKRKFQNRGSLEMSRPAHGSVIGMARASPRPSFEAGRSSLEERRLSVERRRNSLECLAGQTTAQLPARELPALPSGGPDGTDNAGMSPIEEASDEIEEIQPDGEEDEVTATFHAGRLISKLFATGDKPSCLKVRGKQTDGFIVNKRFMDVMNRRNQKQAAELERLRQENLALRNAQAQHQYQQPAAHHVMGMPAAQPVQYTYSTSMPAAQPMPYPHAAMQSSLYAVPTYPPQYQPGLSW
eukprot:CAMPEP_0117675634 /NCGR_PEP_ID=MMETSP0804-20121206/15716_1 /TAXON_ID=1074897 /ORGANISM="Tetraselmis astigmatica, Strain CCMP880" /LENGTH=272 /DNA_ID=CAMNT_0005484663 /DNA_START=330 /DNA_END=1145 /DNA_ORIENTATION=-